MNIKSILSLLLLAHTSLFAAAGSRIAFTEFKAVRTDMSSEHKPLLSIICGEIRCEMNMPDPYEKSFTMTLITSRSPHAQADIDIIIREVQKILFFLRDDELSMIRAKCLECLFSYPRGSFSIHIQPTTQDEFNDAQGLILDACFGPESEEESEDEISEFTSECADESEEDISEFESGEEELEDEIFEFESDDDIQTRGGYGF